MNIRKEIVNFPAGRKLDATIAEYVMGWNIWHSDNEFGYPPSGENIRSARKLIPHYSEDINSAFEVMNKLRLSLLPYGKNGWYAAFYDQEQEYIDFENGIIDGRFGGGYGGVDEIYCVAHTAPLAICRAALLFVHDVED